MKTEQTTMNALNLNALIVLGSASLCNRETLNGVHEYSRHKIESFRAELSEPHSKNKPELVTSPSVTFPEKSREYCGKFYPGLCSDNLGDPSFFFLPAYY